MSRSAAKSPWSLYERTCRFITLTEHLTFALRPVRAHFNSVLPFGRYKLARREKTGQAKCRTFRKNCRTFLQTELEISLEGCLVQEISRFQLKSNTGKRNWEKEFKIANSFVCKHFKRPFYVHSNCKSFSHSRNFPNSLVSIPFVAWTQN